MKGLNRLGDSFWRQVKDFLTGKSKHRESKIKHYFQRGFGVEADVFTLLEPARIPPGWHASIIEMVAVLAVATTTSSFTEVIRILDRFMDAGWTGKNIEAFSQVLMETSRAFYGQGWDREAGRLLKIGEISARRHRRKAIEAQFRRELDRRTVSRLRDQPFLPQRGQ